MSSKLAFTGDAEIYIICVETVFRRGRSDWHTSSNVLVK